MELSRREFLSASAVAAAGLAARPLPALGGAAQWPGYERAIVIDALATPGPFNVQNMFGAPWTAERIASVRASGITAVNMTVGAVGQGGAAAFESTVRSLAFLENELTRHPGVFLRVRSVADIRAAKESRRLGLIAGFQDATMLETDVSRVDMFHQLGVRILQLTYNLRNLLGDGCLEPANAGLSAFGRDVVTRMNERGMLVDLSHCGRQTTLDAIRHSRKPVAFTHTGCSAINDVPRNKTDEQLRALAERGGVVGIFMMPFLRASGQAMSADLLQHIEHALRVAGEDHVGIGSDLSIHPLELTPAFRQLHAESVRRRRALGISAPGETEDVFAYVADMNEPRRLERIAAAMAARGHSSARIEKILGANWLRLFSDVWGG